MTAHRARTRVETVLLQHGDLEVLLIDVEDQPLALSALLTEAEKAVLELLLDGRSNREIAALRAVSSKTVANQLRSIYAKLAVASRCELAALLSDAP